MIHPGYLLLSRAPERPGHVIVSTADDMPEESAKPISMIACGEFDAFCDSGDMMPVAKITVTKMME